jgi:formate transporter
MENLLSGDHASKNTTDSSTLKSFFEIQMLAKQLYPNNDEVNKIILKTKNLFQNQSLDSNEKNMAYTEMISNYTKEIAHVTGLESLIGINEDNGKSESHKNSSHVINMHEVTESESSDALKPDEIAKKMESSQEQKANLNSISTFILAILAGAFIALGGIYFTFATSQITLSSAFTQVLGGLVFSTGLILVVVCGAQLFTGNNLAVMSVINKKITVSKLLKNWTIVYIGNFIGSIATAGVLYMSNMWTSNNYQYGIRALAIANHKVNLGFVEAFFLGILCNVLVCLAIWLASGGKKISDKILAIIFPLSAFVAMGFEHSVANMQYLTFGLMIKNDPLLLSAIQKAGVTIDTSHLDVIGVIGNILPVTLGNIVGGSIFVGLVFWLAYRRNDRKEDNKWRHVADNN